MTEHRASAHLEGTALVEPRHDAARIFKSPFEFFKLQCDNFITVKKLKKKMFSFLHQTRGVKPKYTVDQTEHLEQTRRTS